MRLAEVLRITGQHRQEIASYGVTSLEVFGSVARDEAGPRGDVDMLVKSGAPVGLFKFVRFKNYLEKILGRWVDLTTIGALKEQMREQVLKEGVRAA